MQRYFSNELKDNKFILNSDDIYHITRVMRMKTNDLIEVVHKNKLYICKVTDNIEAMIDHEEKEEHKLLKCTLIIPLLKEQKMDLILQKATELGVSEIIPVMMERSIVKLDNDKEENRINRWMKILKEASEQSKRNDIPTITKVKKIEDLTLDGVKLVCSTTEKSLNIKKFLSTNKNYDKINIVIGPEGGLSLKEEEKLVGLGFTRVSLGSRIMRVETVPLFILSALNYENME